MNISHCSKNVFVALCALFLTTSFVKADELLDKKRDLLKSCIKAKLIVKKPKDETQLEQNKYYFTTIGSARSLEALEVLDLYLKAIKPKDMSYWQRTKSYCSSNVSKSMLLAAAVVFATTAGIPVVAAPAMAAGAPIVANVGLIGQYLASGAQFGFTPQGILLRNYLVGFLSMPTGLKILNKIYDHYLGTSAKK